MPVLTLKFKNEFIKDYRLGKGQSMTIGRRNDNNMVVENLAVSGSHAKIDSVGDGFVLTDLQSKNGSFVNDELIASHWLKNGDVITIGKHTILFNYTGGEEIPDEKTGDMNQTMALRSDKYKEMIAKNVPDGAEEFVAEKSISGSLSFLSGGEGEIALDKKITKIGKASTCDIVAKGFSVGKVSATISKRPDGFFFNYVGGSKPKINGNAVDQSVKLNDFDVIEIGSVKMNFVVKES
jgi:pSer/pThr/pTyr-binding forkhead associated (FHA) protein